MILEQVTERTYANTTGEGRGNFGVISLPNYAVAIDSSMYPSVARQFRTYIQGVTGTPVTKLILTHYHSDHVFGNQVFSDCEIISSRDMDDVMRDAAANWTGEKLRDAVKTRPEMYEKLDIDNLKITFSTRTFDESLTLTDDGFKIIAKKVGGHTSGSTYVYFPADQVLFAGDLIFHHSFPWGGDPTADLDQWISAFREMLQLDVKKIVPGHGSVCDLQEVQRYLDFFEQVAGTMKELIAEGRSEEEVVEFDAYPKFYTSENPERRKETLARWYKGYISRLGE